MTWPGSSLSLGSPRSPFPPLGCGNGGLEWTDVEPLIRRKLGGLSATVQLFAPAGPPTASAMTVATERPSLTEGKAALIACSTGTPK